MGGPHRPTVMPDDRTLEIGDRVELTVTGHGAVGLVIELIPSLLDGDAARVQWTDGKGLVGRTTLHSVKALRKLPE